MSTAKLEFKNSAYLDTAFPACARIYIPGKIHPEVQVPIREISLPDGPFRVYDTRGPWGDPGQKCDVRRGLEAIRLPWIRQRADTVEIEGRQVRPEDNGYLSFKHAATASESDTRTKLESFPGLKRRPRGSASGSPVTQM